MTGSPAERATVAGESGAWSDRMVCGFAIAAWVGAWWASGHRADTAAGAEVDAWPVLVGPVLVGLVAIATRARARGVALLAVALLATWSATFAWAGLRPPEPGPFSGTVTLVGDPQATTAGTTVRASTAVGRVELRARGPAAATLLGVGAGARLHVTGDLAPRSRAVIAAWPANRIVAAVVVDEASMVDRGALHWRIAAWLRGLLVRGAADLDEDDAALLRGLVVGDDRDQGPLVRDAFAAAGLGHLLAVSGQNVAFVLLGASPVLRRLRPWPRFGIATVVLGLFATVTRFEPPVLRAVGMAGFALLAWTLGRPAGARRILAVTVAALVVVDPLLVHSLGFRLSVAATAAIIVGAAPLAERLRGPTWFRLAVAVPIVAQLATAPFLLAAGGVVPVVAVAANVLVEPAVAFVMTWGSSVGLLAGLIGGPVAGVLHAPSRLALGWIDGVARVSAGLPVGMFGPMTLTTVAAGVGIVVLGVGARRRAARVGMALVIAGSVVAATSPGAGPGPVCGLPAGVRAATSTSGATVLVVDRVVDSARTLRELRAAGVRRVEVLALSTASPTAVRAVEPLLERFDPPLVLGPARHERFVAPADGARFVVDDVELTASVRSGTTSFAVDGRGSCEASAVDDLPPR
ncbi:MAG: ComEC/Rec2 family competence protein [Actinobacteria bacterium]|nr:ComEC/Rec2 family competence protein [Actinomycetota bacterium]